MTTLSAKPSPVNPAAGDSLSALRAAPLSGVQESQGSATPARPSPLVVKAAREMARIHAEACNVNEEDLWAIEGQSFIDEAQCVLDACGAADLLASAAKLLERCGPHLQGVEPECCGEYQSDYGGEYMGQREVVASCCGRPIDLSDYVANEMNTIRTWIARATGASND